MNLVMTGQGGDLWADPEPYIGRDQRNPEKIVGLGEGLNALAKTVYDLFKECLVPAYQQEETTAAKFARLAVKWKSETSAMSSVTDMATHPAYQEIIGLGENAIPFLLKELASEPDHWFWALKAITGVDPVRAPDRGDVKEMTRAWVEWGRAQGHTLP